MTTTTETPMRGTYGGKAARFYLHSDGRQVHYFLERDPGTGSMVGTTGLTANVDITEATAEQFGVIAEAWRRATAYLTPTADGGNIKACTAQMAKYLARAASVFGVRTPADLGNKVAREGVDRCYCGCKYWENDQCIDCGTRIDQVDQTEV